MGYFRAPYWGNLVLRSSFCHLFIKHFSIPTWMPCIVLALILFLDFSYMF
jgi:hypothetical protein